MRLCLTFLLAFLLSLNAASAAVVGVCDVLEHTQSHTVHFGHHSPQEAFNYRFTVKPGRATYIGQLNLHLSERGSHKITVEDRRARDMALLMNKAPSLGTVQVTSEVGQVQP